MSMKVRNRFVAMLVSVPCSFRHGFLMCVLMVFVVDMFVLMLHDLMGMFMYMLLA